MQVELSATKEGAVELGKGSRCVLSKSEMDESKAFAKTRGIIGDDEGATEWADGGKMGGEMVVGGLMGQVAHKDGSGMGGRRGHDWDAESGEMEGREVAGTM